VRSEYQVLRAAIETEIDGYRYFLDAAERSSQERATSAWLSLAGDEVEHMQILQTYLSETIRSSEPGESSDEIAERAMISVTRTVPENVDLDDDLAALRAGLEVEARTRDFYTRAAASTEIPTAREVYERLAEMEAGHYRLIDETYRFLADPRGSESEPALPSLDCG
jgi:rubrerythrin